MNKPPHAKAADSSWKPTSRGIRWWFHHAITPLLMLAAGLILIVVLGFAQRAGWLTSEGSQPAVSAENAGVTYTCPMHPQIRQPSPGRCPICGMELVPAASSGTSDLDDFAVRIEPAQRRLANIQTAEVQYEPVVSSIATVGSIAIDESRMATIASYVDGRIERLFADYTGVQVAKGDHLAVVYSPELFSAQVEYLESRNALGRNTAALAAVRQAQEKLLVNSRRKLQELGLTENQIRQLESSGEADSRQTIYAPIGGTVTEKLAVEGKYVTAGEPIYRIADLSTVWLKLELYPEDASRIRFGQLVHARVTSLPDQVFEGRVAFIDPTVNERRRSVGVRVEFLNEDGDLRPGDYADATIFLPIGQRGEVYDANLAGKWISPMHPQIIRDAPGECPICGMELVSTTRYGYSTTPVEQPAVLHVPRSALLMAGKNTVVYVETEPGRFEIRPITLGPLLRDRAIILSGLKAGEKVATAGNFLIDSQMQLAGKPSLIDPAKIIAKTKQRNRPLTFSDIQVTAVGGETGDDLESLYRAYFRIQASLAGDQKPTAEDATTLHNLARSLSNEDALIDSARSALSEIATHSEHLHHLDLEKARLEAFRPVSHAIVKLATQVRGSAQPEPFHHMYCPMVPGGAGDWLQADAQLRNPYWGSQMYTCGDVVRSIPASPPADDGPNVAAEAEPHAHEAQP